MWLAKRVKETLLPGTSNVCYNQPSGKEGGMKARRGTKGFTLIEVLIGIMVLAMLAVIAIPAHTRYAARAKMGVVVESMEALKGAVAAYYATNHSLPASADARAIESKFGIDIATHYTTFRVDHTGVITATIRNVNAATDGQIITLTPDQTFTIWAWGGLRTCHMPSHP